MNNRLLSVAVIALLLTGCAGSQPSSLLSNKPVLRTDLFPEAEDVKVIDAQKVFLLSPEAKQFVRSTQSLGHTETENMRELVSQIFDHSQHGIRYRNDANSTAAVTFEKQAANCLSLTIMAFAMAKEADFNAVFYEVDIPEYWTRREGVNLLNGHVNLRIASKGDPMVRNPSAHFVDVDFDPQTLRGFFPRRIISRSEVLAMFYNNLGADALMANNFASAFAHFQRAVEYDPSFGSIWVNLGVLYRYIGALSVAEESYKFAIQLDDENLTAWENLALLYDAKGESEASSTILNKVARNREENPFYHFILGEEAMENGDASSALVHYRRARQLDRNRHEVLFGLGKAYYRLGDVARAKSFMELQRKTRQVSRMNLSIVVNCRAYKAHCKKPNWQKVTVTVTFLCTAK